MIALKACVWFATGCLLFTIPTALATNYYLALAYVLVSDEDSTMIRFEATASLLTHCYRALQFNVVPALVWWGNCVPSHRRNDQRSGECLCPLPPIAITSNCYHTRSV